MNFNTLSGSAKFMKKLEIRAMGQTTPSGEVPNIAVLCAVDRFSNLRLVEQIALGVKTKGGIVSVVDVPAFGFLRKINPMTAEYAASFAQTAASNAEAIIRCGLYDGVVIVADCDVTAAGLLTGAARANCPALVISVGVSAGASDTKDFKTAGLVAGGKLNARQGDDLVSQAADRSGVSVNFNSVSTFFILCEAMGLCVPTASTTQMNSAPHFRNAAATGEAIFESAKNVLAPKKFLTRAALGNAIAFIISIGGDVSAISTVTNLVSIYEKIPHEIIAEYSAKVPLLVEPQEQNCDTFMAKYSIAKIYKYLAATPKLIDETALDFTGERLRNILAATESAELAPVSKTARVYLVRGSACENGGYVQATENTPASISGKAWVYSSLEDADKALAAGSIPDGSVVVVQNCADISVSALCYTVEGMERQIAIVTDGLCDKTSILAVTRCSPDTFANEEFANIQNGDQIEIDLGRGRINTSASAKDLKIRAKRNDVKKPVLYFGQG